MVLTERDKSIMNCLAKFSFLLGRHIKVLFFDGTRACDRRLKLICENQYLKREKILYGVPYLYSLAPRGQQAIHAPVKSSKIRVDQIHHDIAVVDTVLYIMDELSIPLSDMTTEKQLHRQDGFGMRKHHPDFVFWKDNQTVSVELEMSLKAKTRLEKNIADNFMKYDGQFWIVPDNQLKIIQILEDYIRFDYSQQHFSCWLLFLYITVTVTRYRPCFIFIFMVK